MPFSVGNDDYLATLQKDEVCSFLQNKSQAKSLVNRV